MVKNKTVFLLILLFLITLTVIGCSSESKGSESPETIAEEFFSTLKKGDINSASDYLTKDLKQKVNPQVLQALVNLTGQSTTYFVNPREEGTKETMRVKIDFTRLGLQDEDGLLVLFMKETDDKWQIFDLKVEIP